MADNNRIDWHVRDEDTQSLLIRTMVHMGLIEKSDVISGFSTTDYLPVAHYARSGFYDELEAVTQIGSLLGVRVHRLGRREWGFISDLILQSPCNAVPETEWIKFKVLPIAIENAELVMVMANPLDHEAIKTIELQVGIDVKPEIGLEAEIREAYDRLSLETGEEDLESEKTVQSDMSDEVFHVEPDSSKPGVESEAGDHEHDSSIRRQKILLVEDDKDVRFLLRSVLENDFYDVVEAVDGKDALEKVYGTDNLELVILDLMMPVMNGEEFLKHIRQDHRTKKLPVLVLTAKEGEETEISLLKYGANDYVGKSTRSEVFLARVRRLANLR